MCAIRYRMVETLFSAFIKYCHYHRFTPLPIHYPRKKVDKKSTLGTFSFCACCHFSLPPQSIFVSAICANLSSYLLITLPIECQGILTLKNVPLRCRLNVQGVRTLVYIVLMICITAIVSAPIYVLTVRHPAFSFSRSPAILQSSFLPFMEISPIIW